MGISTLEIENLSSVLSNSPKENERFLITAEVYDLKFLPELQKGLITYLETNDFVKVRVEQNRALYKEMLKTVEKEIKDMGELKKKIASTAIFFKPQKATSCLIQQPSIRRSLN